MYTLLYLFAPFFQIMRRVTAHHPPLTPAEIAARASRSAGISSSYTASSPLPRSDPKVDSLAFPNFLPAPSSNCLLSLSPLLATKYL